MECLHVDFSREYIEQKLGIPKSISEIQISNNSYYKTIYTDKYYTLLCYYNQTGLLLGYMLISNRKGFDFNSYRSDIELLKYSVSEAREKLGSEGIESDIIKKEHFSSSRIDNNRYYYECKMQHSWGGQETYYIGFGFTDIGYHSVKIEPDMNIENVKINFITIFKECYFEGPENHMGYNIIDFINEEVITGCSAGISKGELINLSEDWDFNQKIKEYLKE